MNRHQTGSRAERTPRSGNRRWRVVLDEFNVGRPLARHDGVLVNMTDDGDPGPLRLSRAGVARRAVHAGSSAPPGPGAPTGVHAAKVEVRGDDIVGLAVHSRREPVPWSPTRCSWPAPSGPRGRIGP